MKLTITLSKEEVDKLYYGVRNQSHDWLMRWADADNSDARKEIYKSLYDDCEALADRLRVLQEEFESR